ncbi:MAG: OsmC family protein [Gemmatimonadota bacterium]|nr:MAG: OsmC family protein [Gemmatimonadota bacterium]
MAKINNVDVDAMHAFAAEIAKDPGAAKKLKSVTGRWVFTDGKPQFSADIDYPRGKLTTETDFAPFMGGAGLKPDPVSYCMYGFASCFAGTYAAVAAAEGVQISSLEVTVENEIDLSRPMGVADRPVTQGMKATLKVRSETPVEKLEEIMKLAEERCPGVYCITNPIPFRTRLETS